MDDPLTHGLDGTEDKQTADPVGADEYRAVFGSDTGRRVLTHILCEMGYFRIGQTTPEAIALNNQAKRILESCGMLTRMKNPQDMAAVQNFEDIVNALFNVPRTDKNTGKK